MVDRTNPERSEKGLSAGVLALVFFLWVGVCAIFFSLGYLVGYNERTSKFIPTERVAAPSAVPPTSNPMTRNSEPRPREQQAPETATSVSPRATAPPTAPNAAAPTGEVGVGYTVQVAATRTKQDAESLVGILKGRGYPVFLIAPGQSGAKDELYRVQVGPFTSREDAEKVRARLVQEGFKPFIKQ